ncbi:hypothetical protein Ctha_2713 [Chloroherpeton thalassium ATCC 35110]|uniref:Uncharacterized protein n=1 Tax=Chloroherpeton thalassium (strain ATCC 35110 / GB-78) TaxID=517418 RepID=B3QYT9_CHLT3|nr:bacterial transcriptional activator domain-containing protein [Chloroherpeton thalassium]ACF15162.1 hypothetical protein Ctha_2713 [Chloroherpeton thalassium ATCC 35110]
MKSNSQFSHGSLKLADYYMQAGLFSEAVTMYREALRAEPMSNTLYLPLGLALYKSGQESIALEILYRGGIICLRNGKLTRAQKIHDEMKSIDKTARTTLLLGKEIQSRSVLSLYIKSQITQSIDALTRYENTNN